MITLLKLSEIKRTTEMQPRTTMQMAVAEDYAEDIKAGAKFPPLTVFHVDEEYILVDGFHRALALQSAGAKKAQCEVLEGTMRDAFLYASGVNAGHGLRRTNDDKRRAVERLLNDPEWSQWSDNKIAEICHVSDKTVARYRGEVTSEIRSEGGSESPKTRLFATKHGTVAKMNTENIGKKSVSGLGPVPKDHPNHGVGCAQPGSLPAETDAPVQPSLAEAIKNEPHGSSAFHTAAQELAAKQNGIAGEMFPDPVVKETLTAPAWTPAACPACEHVIIQKVLGNKCKQTGGLCQDVKECPVERRKQMAQEQGFVIAGTGAPSLQGKPLINEHPPLKVIPVQLTKEQAEAAITSVVRGYFTPKSQEQWTQLKKVGGWDTDLEALEGLRDDAAERME